MILLALESATVEVGAAIAGDHGVLSACAARPGRRHVETLHRAVSCAAALASVTLEEVGAVAVDVGPGLFTGIRVGLAAAKGFALALGVPAIALTSLEVLSHAARCSGPVVVPVVDMRRGEVAWQLGGTTSVGGTQALAAALATLGAPALLVGDGARRHGAALVEAVAALGGPPPRLGGDELGAPPVASLADLGLRRLEEGRTIPAEGLAAEYLRAPDARINFASRSDPAPAGDAGGPFDAGFGSRVR